MSELFRNAAQSALRVMLAKEVCKRNLSRSLTPQERAWASDGWVPATLATPEVRDV